MNTRSNRNYKNNPTTFSLTSRSLVLTAVAVAALNSAVYAQTNSSSGINRKSAKQAAQTPAGTRRGTAPSTPAGASVRAATSANAKAAAAPKKATRASSTSTARKTRQTSAAAPRAVKITIRGNRADVRQARQQGIQSLQNANAAVAAREAQRAADAEAAANASNQAKANNGFQQPGDTSAYGFVPGYGYGNFGNTIGAYGYGNNLYGSVSTTQPIQIGATPFGAANQTFPSFYTNFGSFGPSVYSTYSTFGPVGPFGF